MNSLRQIGLRQLSNQYSETRMAILHVHCAYNDDDEALNNSLHKDKQKKVALRIQKAKADKKELDYLTKNSILHAISFYH